MIERRVIFIMGMIVGVLGNLIAQEIGRDYYLDNNDKRQYYFDMYNLIAGEDYSFFKEKEDKGPYSR